MNNPDFSVWKNYSTLEDVTHHIFKNWPYKLKKNNNKIETCREISFPARFGLCKKKKFTQRVTVKDLGKY